MQVDEEENNEWEPYSSYDLRKKFCVDLVWSVTCKYDIKEVIWTWIFISIKKLNCFYSWVQHGKAGSKSKVGIFPCT